MKFIFSVLLLFPLLLSAQTITVTAPNGGERLNSCTAQNISWTSAGTSNYFNIDYSLDNGITWSSIATSYNTTTKTFSWNVPNVSSVNSIVRVTDALDVSTFDVSNNVFIINGALIVLNPNGGENFITGTTQNITYSYLSGVVNNIKIDYTFNNGISWNSITTNTIANGSYAWTIPNTPSTTVKIKLTDLTDPGCKTDSSNTNFTITSSLAVIAPNGGESLQAVVGAQGTTIIMNNAAEKINTASFFDDGGLQNNYSNTSFTKTITPDFPTNKLKVTFQSYTFESGDILYVYDGPSTSSSLIATLSGNFSGAVSYQATNAAGALTFKFQSDGDANLAAGWDAFISSLGTATTNINWNIVGTSKYFDIDYSVDGGANWLRIISNYYTTTGVYGWQVPNTPTTQGRVRITDARNNIIIDQSDANFTILAALPVFILNTPNGGESLNPSTTFDITWKSAFTGNNVALEYSIDNGVNWNNIIASQPNVTQLYTWTVPNTPSTQCLVRVKDAANSSASDVSNAVFTILPLPPFVQVTSPNGGESGARCSNFTITWNARPASLWAAGGTSGVYKLEYSSDGGSTWNLINNSVSCGTNTCGYGWTLPNIINSQIKVRVSDAADLTKTDMSDASMSITLPASPVRLLSPNGGENWVAGTTQNIMYTYGTGTTQVNLEYSADSLVTWTSIVNNTTANGNYAWLIPNVPSSKAFVRVTGNQYNGCDYDVSDAKFTLASSVVVTSPNGGESWQATVGAQGTSINMSNATMVVNTANYYDDGGLANTSSTVGYVQTLVPDNPLNKINFYISSWVIGYNQCCGYRQDNQSTAGQLYVYNGPSTSFALLGMLNGSGSGANFQSTHPSGALTIRYVSNGNPANWNGYVTSVGTTTKNITWNIVGTSKVFDIDYSQNGGSAWTRVVSNLSNTTGVYGWQVPNTPTTQGRVRVRDVGNNVIVDSSDANFTITSVSPVFVLTSPNGGESLNPSTTATIKWYDGFVSTSVALEYSIDNGVNWLPIINSYTNNDGGAVPTEGTYLWTIPNTPSTQCLVRVKDAANSSASDVSNAVFTILPLPPFVQVTSPNGGESGARCSNFTITWNARPASLWAAGGTSGVYKLEYSSDGGSTWNLINNSVSCGTNTCGYGWTLPNIINSQIKVRVSDAADLTKTDMSDASMSITLPASPVRLLSPNGGENWVAGTTQNIMYTYGTGTTQVNLEYSADSLVTWTSIVNNTTANGNYAWLIPNVPSSKAFVRVTGNQYNGCDYDVSDAKFTLASSVVVTSPNGGESWQATVGAQGTSINMSNATMVVNTANYYDDGGLANTSSTVGYVQTLVPDNPLNKINFYISSWVIGYNQCCGYRQDNQSTAGQLYVYNGPSTSFALLGMLNGSGSGANFQSTHPSGALTIRYVSNGNPANWNGYVTSVGTTTKNITWNIVGTSKVFDIDYSQNGGSAWTRVVSNLSNTTGVYGWQVPNTPTTQGRVRVRDVGNNVIVDSSDANFTITSVSPVFVLTSPNGGESLNPSTTATIKWYDGFVSTSVALEYSIDNGVNWLPIINSYTNNDGGAVPTEGTYLWTIPNTPSTQCLVRVKDAANSSASDVSNAVFTILPLPPFVQVTSPNGGESGARCSNFTITWNARPASLWAAGGTSGVYKLEYSSDGGSTWNLINNSVSCGTNTCGYGWTLPNIINSQIKVRVSDAADLTKTDMSDASMSITLPASPVRLLSPNGGENWVAGTTQNIMYTYGTGTTQVNLEYSADSLVTWTSIVNNTTANGNYAWLIPNVPSSKAFVRVTGNQYNGCDYDVSDAKFTLASSVVVTSPNGGESWQATVGAQGTSINMSNATMVVNTANYYDDGGLANTSSTVGYVQTLVPDNPLNKINFYISSWVIGYNQCCGYRQDNQSTAGQLYVYNGPSTSFALLGMLNGSGSGANFQSTHPSGALTIRYVSNGNPANWNGYVTSVGTTTKNITWNIVGTSKVFDIDYSQNGGSAWTRVVSNLSNTTGVYGWQVPNTPTTQGRVRVRDVGNNVIVDSSDANFTITSVSPVFVLTSPNGGESLNPSTTATIKWYDGFVSTSVALEYSIDNGVNWLPIINSYTNNDGGAVPTEGTYLWTIPNTPSTQCLVRVKDAANSSASDVSNAVFTILPLPPFVQVTSPNGGESGARCSNFTITWNARPASLWAAGGTSGVYKLEYSSDGGSTWNLINNSVSCGTNTCGYGWTLPNIINSQIKVRVSDAADLTKTDMSDASMSITLPASPVRLLSPNGGENWVAGTTQNIMYTYGTGTTQVNLEYSADSLVTWTSIVNNTTANGNYAWLIPNVPSSKAFVRVTGNQYNGCDYDVSDAKFTLASSVVVTSPNGGESWQATVGAQGTSINMSNATMVVNTANYYDDGGLANTSSTVGYVQTLVPDNPLNKINFYISSWVIGYNQCCGYRQDNQSTAGQLYVYNGPSTSFALLGMLNGSGSGANFQSTHPSGALTIRYVSNGNPANWNGYVTSVGTTTKNITWNIVGTSKVFDIDYSQNGGSAWTRVVSNLSNTTGVYGWQVPNTPTTQGRVRVRDVGNNVIVDSSDANFTITSVSPVFVLTSPNGGESLNPSTTATIKWYDGFVSTSVALEYSIDNGVNWLPIINSYTNNDGGAVPTEGTYLWTIPNTPSTQCLVRVKDAANSSASDVSNAVFTILPLPPFVQVTSPNGGESGARCSNFTITWNARPASLWAAGGTSGVYKLEYSSDGGSTWNLINNSVSCGTNTCGYGWTLPNIINSQIKVRVSDAADLTKTDMSDASMSITLPASPVRLLSPNGGENWVAGTTQNIMYTYGTGTTQVNLEYSADSLVTWTSIVNNTTANGNYAWLIPNVPSSKAFVRVTGNQYNGCDYDVSDAKFTLASSVVVTSPNGGESWQATVGAQGTSINMSNATMVVNTANYYDDGGLANTSSTVGYVQTLVPDNPLNKINFYISSWVIGYNQCCGYRQDNQSTAGQLYVYNGPSTSFALLGMLNGSGSGANFQSTHPSGALTIRYVSNGNPANWNGYVTSVGTTTKNITWNIVGTSKVFDIDYSQNGGSAWTRVVSNLSNTTGVYGWQVPNTPTTQGRVRVRDVGNNVIVDSSDANFTITAATPFVIVNSPNGGERFYPGQTKTITWQAPTFNITDVKIEYTTDAGATWNLITASTQNTGSYNWIVPTVTSIKSNCKIRISKADESYYFDESNNVFEIRPGIIITSPNNNSSLFQSCTQSSVTWQGDASTSVKIELSLDSGATWSTINSNVGVSGLNNTYSWSIPNTPSLNSLVRVTDNNNVSYTDVSDSVFTLKPSLVLNYPSYGATFATGAVAPISWTSYGTSNYYNIDYSTNNGSTWTNITTNTYITNSIYNWTVPASESATVKVRITDFANACKTTTSVSPFIITTTPSNIVLAGTSTSTLNSCELFNIAWTSPVSVSNVNLLYSLNGGTTWNVMQTNVDASLRTYSWTVPNIASTQTLFKIVDAANPNNFDISRGLFTINPTLSVSISANKNPVFCFGDTVTLTSSQLSNNLWSNGETTRSIKVFNSGSFSVINSLNGCSASSNVINVIANSVPAKPIITLSGSSTICGTDKTVLVSNNSSGNTWLPGGQTTQSISTNIAGSYALMYTNQFGCTSTSLPVNITVIDNNTTPVITSPTSYVSGSTISLKVNAINNASYLWTGPNNFSSRLQNPTINNAQSNMTGLYTVVATIANCNTAPASVSININNQSTTLVTGQFLNYRGENIPNVGLSVTGTTNIDTTTSLQGNYGFNGVIGGAYTLAPYKRNDGQRTNGVSTLDIIKIQSHILKIDTLDSPYKIIASDVNSSGAITSLDLLYIRRLILGIDQAFPGNKLWAFIDSTQVFSDRTNPFPFRNTKSIGSLSVNTRQSFIGVKLGDVNDSWNSSISANEFQINSIGSKTSQSMQNVILKSEFSSSKNDTIYVKIKAKYFNKIKGLQGTLSWNAQNLRFIEILNNPLNIEFNMLNIISGKLPMLFNDAENKSVTLADNDLFLTLKFLKKSSFITDSIELNSSITPVECYNDELEICNVFIEGSSVINKLNNEQQIVDITSSRLYPNPTTGLITLDLFSQKQEQTNLMVYDEEGHEKYMTSLYLTSGINKIKVDMGSNIYIRSKYYIIRVVVNGKPLIYKILLL